MKRNHLIVLALLVALAAGAVLLNQSFAQEKTTPAATPTKAAVCDVVAVFRQYQRAKELTDKLKERLDAVKKESDERGKAIETIDAEMGQLKLGSPEYDNRLNEKTKLTIERQAYLAFQDDLAKRENFRLTKDMYDDILKVIEKISKERGYQLVMFREPSDQMGNNLEELLQTMARRKVLYNAPSLDITEDVLMRLNEEFKSSKK